MNGLDLSKKKQMNGLDIPIKHTYQKKNIPIKQIYIFSKVFSNEKKKKNVPKEFFYFYVQMFPVAVTCGNTFILKPSEKDPGDCQILPSIVICEIIEFLLLITMMHWRVEYKGLITLFVGLKWQPVKKKKTYLDEDHFRMCLVLGIKELVIYKLSILWCLLWTKYQVYKALHFLDPYKRHPN